MIAAFGGGRNAVPTAGGKLPPTGGGESRTHGGGKIAAAGGGESRCSPAGTKGDRTPYGFLSPLDSPHLPLRCDSLRSRGETGETGARFRASGRFWDAVMP